MAHGFDLPIDRAVIVQAAACSGRHLHALSIGVTHLLPIPAVSLPMESSDYLVALRRAIDDGSVRAELDFNKLDHIDSPIVVQAEKTRWIYAIMALTLGGGWFFGWQTGIGTALAGAVVYIAFGRRLIHRRMRQRFDRLALHDLDQFRRLWRLTGVSLISTRDGSRCDSPDGNWIRFMMTQAAVALQPVPPQSGDSPSS